MPLSDLEMANTRRIPNGTRITTGMGNIHTRIGDLAASKPEKKVTLYQGCCSSRQTVLTAMSLTDVARRQERGRMRYWSRAVGADNAVSTGGTSVKRRNDGIKMPPRCLQVTPHAIRRAIPVGVEICVNLTRIYIKHFSVIASLGVPPKQLGYDGSEIVERDWES